MMNIQKKKKKCSVESLKETFSDSGWFKSPQALALLKGRVAILNGLQFLFIIHKSIKVAMPLLISAIAAFFCRKYCNYSPGSHN